VPDLVAHRRAAAFSTPAEPCSQQPACQPDARLNRRPPPTSYVSATIRGNFNHGYSMASGRHPYALNAAPLIGSSRTEMSQQSHRSDPRILNRRTLRRNHPNLPRVLRTRMTILDVGCGTGAITADIANAVGPGGRVLGIDRDDANLAIAIQEHRGIGNLRFESADILTLDVSNRSTAISTSLQPLGQSNGSASRNGRLSR
jgi:2-polyprenyl-3-methyl-5-hydroxy-6-metoxy-1,4-benzoquinol methylase